MILYNHEFIVMAYIYDDDGGRLYVTWCMHIMTDTPDYKQALIDLMCRERIDGVYIYSARYIGMTNYYHQYYRRRK